MTDADGAPGIRLPGYRLGDRIGSGGFSAVYEAVQLSLDRPVAVKVLHADLGTPSDRARFERERQVLTRLSGHRNVVDVIDAGVTAEGRPFIVMRLHARGSLAQELAGAGPLPVARAVDVTATVASALQAAHDQSVVHRDVKPENILLADDGEPVLADFGIASLLNPTGTASTSFFSLAHAAPEVLEHPESRLAASDQYSLASTAYMLLRGQPAFVAAGDVQRIYLVMDAEPPALGRGDVPPAVEAAIRRGMAKDPADRFPSMTAFAEALRDGLDSAPTAAAAQPAPEVPPAPYPPQPPQPVSYQPPSYQPPYQPPSYPPPNQPVPYRPPPYPAPSYPPPSYQPPPYRPVPHQPPSHPQPSYPPPSYPPPPVPGNRRALVVAAAGAVATLLVVVVVFVVWQPFGSGSPGTAASARTSPALSGASGAGTSPSGPGASASGAGRAVVIATDLPLQGATADSSRAANQAVALYLDRIAHRAGPHTVTVRTYDDATAAAAKWDVDACTRNAAAHVAHADEVAVVGTYNSGCSKVEVPVLDRDPTGPMVMVSHANTNPGLTKTWDSGEPDLYYPAGKRTYARVVPTDDVQGAAAAGYARTLGVHRVYVLDDGELYGRGVARRFAASAVAGGMTVSGQDTWDAKATSFTDLFHRVQAAGADAVFLAGVFDNAGAQLVKDKVAVLGDNAKVKLLASDGFTGYPQFTAMPEAQGAYLTFPGLQLTQLEARGGAAASFLAAYRARYGTTPGTPYALYAVAATQAVLQALAASDGTRKGLHDAMFGGTGITVGADVSVLGRAFRIDPTTGDVDLKDVTVEVVKNAQETYAAAVTG